MHYFFTIVFITFLHLNLYAQNTQYHFLEYKLENDLITVNDSKSQNFIFEFQKSDCNANFDVSINNVIYVP